MTLPDFLLEMSEVEKTLLENKGRRAPRQSIILGTGGGKPGHWQDIGSLTSINKQRIQSVLNEISEVHGLPPLFLCKVNKFYKARQYSEDGVPHPLIRIVGKHHSDVTVLWRGEVWG